eukprot:CAMPEP_0204915272 /NCGR_PEP_ID=MMETSP1397-20131031/13298_1 /ASSEMBLY_ACC=CAM_ASM_000891 /TAXON_ID=49980 /ORGANISM="Climacostomum Climacostomum virens, Strain Stock W-24" /LENGTH=501 /DNA_ID=CAMNT_0052087235 /DNA_START=68 /DNA_END=1573 /DNA_ORIENTATION=-
MTDIRDRELRRKHILEALLAHLNEKYADSFKAVCAELNYDPKELLAKPVEDFASPGTSSEIQQLRWQHFEERRVTKVTAVALEVAKGSKEEDEKFAKLLRFFGLSKTSQYASSSVSDSSIHEGLSPMQLTSKAFEREQKKFEKALKVHDQILHIKAEEDEKKRQKTQRRQQKLKLIEKEAKQRLGQLMGSLEKQEAKRRQVQEKKEELERKQLEEQMMIEKALIQRMQRFEREQQKREKTLSEVNQNGFRMRDQERRRHSVERLIKESNDAQYCAKTLTSLKDKLDHGFTKSNEFAQRRIELNKQHAEKVDMTLYQSLMNEQKRTEEQLQKMVEKSKITEYKKSTKESKFKEKVTEVTHELQDKFSKHNQTFTTCKSEMKRREEEIIKRRQKKEKLKEKLFDDQGKLLERRAEKNQLRLQDRAENYGRALMAHQKSKQKVLEKHKRVKMVAEQLEYEKSNLANKSVKNSLHLQRLRTAGTPINDKRYRSLSSSIQNESFEV